MNRFKPIRAVIKDIKLSAEGVKTYTLSISGSGKKVFSPEPGQFNMVGHPAVGEAPISLSSIFYNGYFDHTIKAVGRVTGFLNNLDKDDELFLRGPYGKGWPVRDAAGKDVLLIAGGVGLAPIRPVIQTILNRRGSFNEVSLIYGARNEKNILFMDEFETWGKGLLLYLTVDEVSAPGTWKYNMGLVTDLLDRVRIRTGKIIVFVCGPEIMMRFICRGLLMFGVPQTSIYVSMERRMKCGIAQCGHCQHYGLFVCKDGPVFSYKEVRGLPDGML